jgi:hypothetical protein
MALHASGYIEFGRNPTHAKWEAKRILAAGGTQQEADRGAEEVDYWAPCRITPLARVLLEERDTTAIFLNSLNSRLAESITF